MRDTGICLSAAVSFAVKKTIPLAGGKFLIFSFSGLKGSIQPKVFKVYSLASASKIIIIDCRTLDTSAYIEMTQEVIRAREEDEKYMADRVTMS